MADKPENKEQKEVKKEVVTVCTLNVRQILVALHEKALEKAESASSGEIALTVQNSAIEGAGGNDAKFYGAGQHIIAAIPKDNKGIANNKVEKKDAIPVLQAYVQWFVGPDLKDKVKEDVLKPLENGAEGKVSDNHEKKEDIEKSKADSVAGEKYEKGKEPKKESIIFVPSFKQYLLTEEGEADSDEAAEKGKKDAEEVKDKNKKDAEKEEGTPGEGLNTAQGWYVEYKMVIPGQKEHSIADAMKNLTKDIIKAFGVKGWNWGSSGKEHTIGDLVDSLDAVFGKMDVSEFEPAVSEELRKRMKQTSASAQVWDTATILKYLKKEIAHDKSKVSAAKYALCVRVDKNDKSYDLFNEDAIANVVNAAISHTSVGRGLGKRLRGFGVKGKDVILVNNYKDNKKAKDNEKFDTDKAEGAVRDSLIVKNRQPLIVESMCITKKDILDVIFESCFNLDNNVLVYNNKQEHIKVNNKLLESIFSEIDESLLLEGHSEEQLNVEKEIDRIGVENLTKNVDDLRKNYFEYLKKVKKENSKNEYVQKILVNSKNWISKEFIGKLRDQEEADTDTIKKMLKDCVSRVGKTNDVRFELQALVDAMKNLPDGPKKDDEDKEDGDKITITFRDVDDPGQLSDPESPTDEDKEKYKTVGDPLKLVPGEDVTVPEIKNKGEKGEWEFMGFEPDPENMDESGYTYAIYTKNGPDTVKITFYDADPETGDKLKEPLGKPIEIPVGKEMNSSPDAQKAFEEYNEKLEKDKKDGYVFKGWNPDPKTKVEDDTDVVAKYIEEGEKDTKYTVMFQYAPDQEKKDDTEVIQVDGKDEQEVAAGEKATRPDAPEIEGYKFKDWGEDEKNLDNVQDDIVAVAQYSKNIMINPKAPKDPAKPDKDLEPIVDPFEYDPKKPLEKQLPEPPKKDGWKPTGEWDPDPTKIKDPKEDIDIIPKYEKDDEKKDKIKLIFRAPKDPEKPEDTEIIKKEPYDPDLDIKDQAPEPPEKKGWHFKDWNPKLEEIKDPKENTSVTAEYGKGIAVKFKMQDPLFKNKAIQNLIDAFDPIDVNKDKIDDIKIPNHKDAKDIPAGYTTYGKTTWLLPPYKEDQNNFSSDTELKDKIKSYIENNPDNSELIVILRLASTQNFVIKVVDVDPEKPNDESKETDIANIYVYHDSESNKNLYKPADIKKISDRIHAIKFPDEKLAKKLDDYIEHNTEALKTIEQKKTSSKGDYKLDPEKLMYAIQAKSESPGDLSKMSKDKDGNKFVKVKTSYGKEQFKVKIIQPDAEDPDNTKSQKEVATITVFQDAEGMHYKADDLAKLAKDVKTKDEADKYNKAAKDNEAAFKAVDNIQALTKDYKFQGWAGPKTEEGKTQDLEEIINAGPADGEEEITVKAKFGNDIKAKHTDIDFYIVPMKGLKEKRKHKDNSGSK